jgi:hypothetical protein
VSCTRSKEVGGAAAGSCGAAVALAESVNSIAGSVRASVVVRRLATVIKTV